MNSNRLNAAQLLMNFTAHENGRICQKIHDTEFSQELQSVTQVSQPEQGVETILDVQDRTPPSERTTLQDLAREVFRRSKREGQVKAARSKSMRTTLERSRTFSRKPSQSSRPEESEQPVVTNPLVLDKIMAQLQFTAEARQACKEAISKQGNLSIDALIAILGQKQTTGQTGVVSPVVSALDVQELVNSVKMGTSADAAGAKSLKLKQSGSYTIQELKELFQPLTKDAARNTQHDATSKKLALLNSSPGPEGAEGELNLDAGEWEAPEGHVEQLSISQIPSFSTQQSGRSDTMRRDLPSIHPKSRDEGLQSDGQRLISDGALDSVQQAPFSRMTGQNRQYSQNSAQTGVEPDPFAATMGEIQRTSEGDSMALQAGSADARDGESSSGSGSREQSASSSPSAMVNGREPIPGGVTALFKAGDAPVGEYQENAEGWSDPPSTFEIGSPASSGQPYTSTGYSGSEGSPSNQHQGKPGAKEFQLGQDLTAGAQHTETDAVFSLSPSTQSSTASGRVDEGTRKVNVYQPDWTQRISEQLQERARQGKSSLVVELDPQDLGRMTLRIEADQRHVTAWVTTQSEETRNLLLQNTSALQKHLADHGMNLGQFSVNVGDERGNQGAYAGGRNLRRATKTAGKTSALPGYSPGVHSRIQGEGANQMISLIA